MKKIMTLIAAISIASTILYGCGGKETAVPTTSGGGQNVEAAERILNLQSHQIHLNGQNTASYSWITLPWLQRGSMWVRFLRPVHWALLRIQPR